MERGKAMLKVVADVYEGGKDVLVYFGFTGNPHSTAALSEPMATISMSFKNFRQSGPTPGCA